MAGPIEHVVVIVKENHTFDNYFGGFPGAAGQAQPPAPDPSPDPRHDHVAWLARAHGAVHEGYGPKDIPAYWALAQQYALCDNYFTDVASQSEPNHLFLIAANSPVIDNSSRARASYQPLPPYDMPSLPQALEHAGRQWRNYADAHESYFDNIAALKGSTSSVPSSHFDADVARGFLPDVCWLYASGGLSEHPGDRKGDQPVSAGAQWTMDRVLAVANSALWPKTAIIITWDDWGGWHDHVVPPEVQNWSGSGPQGYAGSQFRYGQRVPCLVVSPWAKAGLINHDMFSHASVVKFCLRLFGLPAWNVPALQPGDRSGDLFSCFDFKAPPRLAVPRSTPA
ncbi:MAG: hypothetical protein KGI67_08550 [Pseudomonadota bacterium]|nr:hypothetical protein [Pseudomonadota bacterium]